MRMVASFAEFDRAMVRERTSAGVAAARAKLQVGGRCKKLGPAERSETDESVNTGRQCSAALQPRCTDRVTHRCPAPSRFCLECRLDNIQDPPGMVRLLCLRPSAVSSPPLRPAVRFAAAHSSPPVSSPTPYTPRCRQPRSARVAGRSPARWQRRGTGRSRAAQHAR